MNPGFEGLHPYPFEKLKALKADATPPEALSHIALPIGEPKHATPSIISEAVLTHLHHLSSFPATLGSAELRQAIIDWLNRRFDLPYGSLSTAKNILPVNGTREALFAFAQAMIDPAADSLVLMPNPFYQIYEGAALLAGARPHYLNCDAQNGFIPDFDAVDAATWERCRILYLCSPGNPTGAVLPEATAPGAVSGRGRSVLDTMPPYASDHRPQDPGLQQCLRGQGEDIVVQHGKIRVIAGAQ